MEFFLAIVLIMTTKIHRQKFSHFEDTAKKSVFFYSEQNDLHLFINGFQTGLQGHGLLYFPQDQEVIDVQWANQKGIVECEEAFRLDSQQTMILMPRRHSLLGVRPSV